MPGRSPKLTPLHGPGARLAVRNCKHKCYPLVVQESEESDFMRNAKLIDE